ncbi:KXD1 [Candida jiufengensis]|uniref:KXD1 n=1 Tax=Candida jiufengensis TaxID=497108 RepID=UPI00222540AE|nr:KXD1 [Candida jiufengensis]KAI5953486.1 KXD1 [Candida jiufengensis]
MNDDNSTNLDSIDVKESPKNGLTSHNNNSYEQLVSTDTDDDYLRSDDDEDDIGPVNEESVSSHLPGIANLGDHAKYFTNSILQALDSSDLDKSLVTEAQISGNLNNENQKLIEKKSQLQEKLRTLQSLFEKNFTPAEDSKLSRMDKLNNDIQHLEKRITKLKNGDTKSYVVPFMKSKKNLGIIEKFPIEYYQATDKVLDRQS